ncbi:MAG: hypothetical protein HPY64_02990 [Anaerolineae bacterium]|nr:hypothetical protein [Anaerolineae bacterium]
MYTVKRVWLDDTEGMRTGSVDVLAEMDDQSLWMARFVTIPYLQEQMDYGLQASRSLRNTPEVRYATIETRHIIVDRLDIDTIEDVIDNLLALDVFESMFALVSDPTMAAVIGAQPAIVRQA